MTVVGLGPFWSRSGVLFRKPGSGSIGPTEALPAIKKRGYGWVAFDPKTGEWKDERRIAAANELDIVAWTRVLGVGMLQDLSTAAIRWQAKAIAPNIEIAEGGPGSTRDAYLMLNTLVAMSHAGKAVLLTDGWADPIGCWHGYRRWVGSVECFPEQDRALVDVDGCMLHANAFFRSTTPMLGSYGTGWLGRKPVLADYVQRPASSPWVVFTGDDVEDWSKW